MITRTISTKANSEGTFKLFPYLYHIAISTKKFLTYVPFLQGKVLVDSLQLLTPQWGTRPIFPRWNVSVFRQRNKQITHKYFFCEQNLVSGHIFGFRENVIFLILRLGQKIYDFIDFSFSQLISFDMICVKFRLLVISKSGHLVNVIFKISLPKLNSVLIKCPIQGEENRIKSNLIKTRQPNQFLAFLFHKT